LPCLYLARHAETVFNAGGRMQGWQRHTPLTSRGIDQARAMATALRDHLGSRPAMDLWCSSAGRAQQTAALIAEALDVDFFDVRLDDRLQEIHVGDWQGRPYGEIVAEFGPVIDPDLGIFSQQAPGGEWYPDIVARMSDWLAEIAGNNRPCLVISHGIASRVLRGMLVGGDLYDDVRIAAEAPQGTVFQIDGAAETRLITGSGSSGAHRLQGL
jgi:broad specificity phosphatase PhoE